MEGKGGLAARNNSLAVVDGGLATGMREWWSLVSISQQGMAVSWQGMAVLQQGTSTALEEMEDGGTVWRICCSPWWRRDLGHKIWKICEYGSGESVKGTCEFCLWMCCLCIQVFSFLMLLGWVGLKRVENHQTRYPTRVSQGQNNPTQLDTRVEHNRISSSKLDQV